MFKKYFECNNCYKQKSDIPDSWIELTVMIGRPRGKPKSQDYHFCNGKCLRRYRWKSSFLLKEYLDESHYCDDRR